jgi:hypothetical protein
MWKNILGRSGIICGVLGACFSLAAAPVSASDSEPTGAQHVVQSWCQDWGGKGGGDLVGCMTLDALVNDVSAGNSGNESIVDHYTQTVTYTMDGQLLFSDDVTAKTHVVFEWMGPDQKPLVKEDSAAGVEQIDFGQGPVCTTFKFHFTQDAIQYWDMNPC